MLVVGQGLLFFAPNRMSLAIKMQRRDLSHPSEERRKVTVSYLSGRTNPFLFHIQGGKKWGLGQSVEFYRASLFS